MNLIRVTPDSWRPETEYLSTAQRVELVRDVAYFIRTETLRLIQIAKSGHFTSVYSCAELLATLYTGTMRISTDPQWPARDRLILSKGHCAVGVYPLLANLGYFDKELLDSYTRVGNPLGDHPDMRRVPGADFSSGSLGHGLSIGTGMALGNRMRGHTDSRIWVLLGDQELNEGQVWEAAQFASHHQLGNVVAIVDRNHMGLDGTTEETLSIEPIVERFCSFGWTVSEIDGHDVDQVSTELDKVEAQPFGAPRCIVADTVKGKGVRYMEMSRTWHLGYLADGDADRTRELVERV